MNTLAVFGGKPSSAHDHIHTRAPGRPIPWRWRRKQYCRCQWMRGRRSSETGTARDIPAVLAGVSSLGARVNTDLRAYPRFATAKLQAYGQKGTVPTNIFQSFMYGFPHKVIDHHRNNFGKLISPPFSTNIPVHFCHPHFMLVHKLRVQVSNPHYAVFLACKKIRLNIPNLLNICFCLS